MPSKLIKALIAGLAGIAMLYGSAFAAGFLYLKKVDIAGETTGAAAGHEDEIEVVSYSWGATGAAKPSGKGPGVMVVTLDARSSGRAPLRAIYDGKREIPELTFKTTENGRTVEYKLESCVITSWSTSGDSDDRPTEEVAFYYNRIAFNYARTTDGK
jgi:type VI protein secretion system component Hcp